MSRSHLLPALLLIGLTGGACSLAHQEAVTPRESTQRAPLTLRYLANEGFLLSAGESDVLIDAFVSMPYAGYAALPKAVYADLIARRAPFDDIELALVSHAHGDHFQPRPAEEFLSTAEETWLISSPQVLAELGDNPTIAPRTRALLPEPGQTSAVHHEGIDVEMWRLQHAGNHDKIQNLGHLIELEGHTILHIGDAAMDAEMFAPYASGDEPFDLALVPYWYWSSSAGRALLAGPLRAHRTIAVHIPPRDLREFVDTMKLDYPAVGVPEEALDGWKIEARKLTGAESAR